MKQFKKDLWAIIGLILLGVFIGYVLFSKNPEIKVMPEITIPEIKIPKIECDYLVNDPVEKRLVDCSMGNVEKNEPCPYMQLDCLGNNCVIFDPMSKGWITPKLNQ
ncbi:MAG: hypothetical protein H6743_03840 [Rickettsiaceae bacterium]|nr:hypothetical protein [Rickettsiaceae bacterium]